MPRKLRYVPEETLVEVTARTIQGRFLLRPSPKLNDRILGVLAKAQARTGMKVCAFVYLSNHCHLLLRPTGTLQLARFMAYVNSNIAREAGRLSGWRERLWGRRYADVSVSHETEAQEQRLRYLLAQGVKEGLVASPRRWPGASSTKALMTGKRIEGEWIDRSEQYRAGRRGEANPSRLFASRHELQLSPLPCWKSLRPHQRQRKVRRLVEDIENDFAASGASALGQRAILEQNPLDRPSNFRRSPAPRFHAIEPQVRRSLEWAYRLFRIEYRQASQDLRLRRRAHFPRGGLLPGGCEPAFEPG